MECWGDDGIEVVTIVPCRNISTRRRRKKKEPLRG
jgi:hypothetical protein